MKLHYHPETDTPYIGLNANPGAEVRKVADGDRAASEDDAGRVTDV